MLPCIRENVIFLQQFIDEYLDSDDWNLLEESKTHELSVYTKKCKIWLEPYELLGCKWILWIPNYLPEEIVQKVTDFRSFLEWRTDLKMWDVLSVLDEDHDTLIKQREYIYVQVVEEKDVLEFSLNHLEEGLIDFQKQATRGHIYKFSVTAGGKWDSVDIFSLHRSQRKFRDQCQAMDQQKLKQQDIKNNYIKITIQEKEPITSQGRKEQELVLELLKDIFLLRNEYLIYNKDILPHPLFWGLYKNKLNQYLLLESVANCKEYTIDQGIFQLIDASSKTYINLNMKTLRQFEEDLITMNQNIQNAILKSYCYMRIQQLSEKFTLNQMYNKNKELLEIKLVPVRDFYNCRKVDTHVHHTACMNSKHLCTFLRKKIQSEAQSQVIVQNQKSLTLQEVFDKLQLTPTTITTDALNTHADHTTFQRFDNFNSKYNPLGQATLREIFLKTDNFIQGRFLAEITQEVLAELESTKYCATEYRISIYGRSKEEWQKLAEWFDQYNLLNSKLVSWFIQIPRIYKIYRKSNSVKNFQEMLTNIFAPVIAATLEPEKYPLIDKLLKKIGGFDCVDDESAYEDVIEYKDVYGVEPLQWTSEENPPYAYWSFYFYSNIKVINTLRLNKGLNVFAFRPHAGEAGSVEHLVAAYLTANGINHGIVLRESPVLQYLYYLHQIGLAMSPLSNSLLFLEYTKNPFPDFFRKGLNVSLSTDDPLMFHMTREPLLEEYSVASQIYKLSTVDLCEIAYNSVLQSSFPLERKQRWVGSDFQEGTLTSNCIQKNNVSDIRWQYRYETFRKEHEHLFGTLNSS